MSAHEDMRDDHYRVQLERMAERLRAENTGLRQERDEYERLLTATRESLHSSSERLAQRLAVVERAAESMEASYKVQVADLVAERDGLRAQLAEAEFARNSAVLAEQEAINQLAASAHRAEVAEARLAATREALEGAANALKEVQARAILTDKLRLIVAAAAKEARAVLVSDRDTNEGDTVMAIEDKIRCGECGQPLSSWAEHHTVEDCAWWKQTQAARDALVGLAALQQKVNTLCAPGPASSPTREDNA